MPTGWVRVTQRIDAAALADCVWRRSPRYVLPYWHFVSNACDWQCAFSTLQSLSSTASTSLHGAVMSDPSESCYAESAAPPALRAQLQCSWRFRQSTISMEPVLILPDGSVDLIWDGTTVFVAGPDRRYGACRAAPGNIAWKMAPIHCIPCTRSANSTPHRKINRWHGCSISWLSAGRCGLPS